MEALLHMLIPCYKGVEIKCPILEKVTRVTGKALEVPLGMSIENKN